MKTFFIIVLSMLFVVPAIAQVIPSDYNQITLTKSAPEPVPYCPVSKISDNDKCMNCHVMTTVEGKPKFGLKEIPLKASFSDKPGSLQIVMHNGEIVGRVKISSTGSEQFRDIADYYYTRPELKRLVMELHTPGGSVLDAWRAVGVIKEMQGNGIIVEVRCYGFAASAGAILLVAGDIGERYVNPHAEVMIHKVWTFAMFDFKTPDSSEDQAAMLKHLQDNINSFIVQRSNITAEKLAECIYKRDYWLTGIDAVELGLADHLIE